MIRKLPLAAIAAAVLLAALCGGCSGLKILDPPGNDSNAFAACLAQKPFVTDTGRDADDPLIHPIPYDNSKGGQTVPFIRERTPDQIISFAYFRLTSRFVDGTALNSPLIAREPEAAVYWPSPVLRTVEWTPFQQFLDCYAGPVDPIDYQARLLRGHILLTMLAEYINFLVQEAPAAKKSDYAREGLQLILNSESQLRASSILMIDQAQTEASIPADKQKHFHSEVYLLSDRSFFNVDRALSLMQVAVLAEQIDTRNSWGWLISTIGSIRSIETNPSAVSDLANSALSGLKDAYTFANFGSALFDKVHEDLVSLPADNPAWPDSPPEAMKVSAPDAVKQRAERFAASDKFIGKGPLGIFLWKSWDLRLAASCKDLATAAGNLNAHCVATWDDMKNAVPFPDELAAASAKAGKAAQNKAPAAKSKTAKG